MRLFLSAIALVTISGLAATTASAQSLGDALASAYKASNLLVQQRATLRAADEDAATALANLRPVIDFTMSGQWKRFNNSAANASAGLATPFFESSGGIAQLTASMLIWGNGRGKIGKELAAENVMAVRAALVSVEQEVLLQAVAAYVDLMTQSEVVELRQANVRLITKQLRAAKDRFELGDATQTDIALAEARLAGAQAQLAASQAAQKASLRNYEVATGAKARALKGLPKPPKVAATLDEAIGIARQNHPNVLQAQHFSRIADLQVQLAQANLGPALSGQVGMSQNLNSGVTDTFASLQFSQTLYKGGALESAYRKAVAQKEAAAAGVMQAQMGIVSGVTFAWNNLLASAAAIEAGDLQVRAMTDALDGITNEAELGSKTTLDVLNAEQELMDARVQLAQNRANRYLAAYQLLSSTGRLTASNLGLGVPVYDPNVYADAVKKAPVSSLQGMKLDRILKKSGD